MRKWILPMVVLSVLLTLALAGGSVSAERPQNCDINDRAIKGNAASECRHDWDVDAWTLDYTAEMDLDAEVCQETVWLVGDFKASDSLPQGWHIAEKSRRGGTEEPGSGKLPNRIKITTVLDGRVGGYFWRSAGAWASSVDVIYGVRDVVPAKGNLDWVSSFPSDRPLLIQMHGAAGPNDWYTAKLTPNPRFGAFQVMMGECLRELAAELEHKERMAEAAVETEKELAQQEAAKRQAEREAELAEVEAQRAAELLAEIERTHEEQRKAIIAHYESQKVIIAAWEAVAERRIVNALEREELANRYLAEIESNSGRYSERVKAKADELKKLRAVNEAIVEAINAYHAEIEALAEEAESNEALVDENLTIEVPSTPER